MLDKHLSGQGKAYIVNPEAHSRAGVEEFRRLLMENGFSYSVQCIIDEDLLFGYEEECSAVRQELYVISRIVEFPNSNTTP
ncbi:hypothetical protein CYMTET_24219 [Cymbomonas tetramitiformis]|uniref:Uncharacterized protein n=1 Tax=Cymbomonas tetramitiformis TaxID=36881 RepID=A0AAE0L097_9CHLO|nr:hypothetical protein CYMTET_24219 [Cymbomonas tetramitiformis]